MSSEGSLPVNVLVVDDDPGNRLAIKSILASPDYRIVEGISGPDALKRLLEDDFAVLLVDVLMPGMDGFEFAAMVKERERMATIPILFLTAQAADQDLLYQGYRVGAVDYLVKPLIPEMVRAKVSVFAQIFRQRKRIEVQSALLLDAERNASALRVMELQLASERRYRNLADAVPDIIWTARPEGWVDYLNQRWFEYTGLSAEATAGSWEAALHPADLARCRTEWLAATRAGEKFETRCRLRRASDGTFRWHLCRAVPERGAHGFVITSWLGTFTDIDDHERSQAELAEFKATLDAVLDSVLIFDADDWHLLYVNRGATVLLGYSQEELLQMRPLDFTPDLRDAKFRDLLVPLWDAGDAVTAIETRFRRKDSHTVPVEVSLQLVHVDRGRIVAIARDITDRRRTQLERELLYREAVAALRARDDFLSIASHELRTPLSSLQLQIQMLLSPSRRDRNAVLSPGHVRTKLQLAARQVERLVRLVTELMDVSKLNAGRLHLQVESVDLSALVREVVARLGDDALRTRTPIDVHADEPIVGSWDRLRVEQVLTNLLTNALKFGRGKPVEVRIESSGRLARMIVRDHGIGIAPEDLDRIFRRYEQAATSRAYGGMGLGLYIVKQIVDAHGGSIHVASSPGDGALFTVELPTELVEKRREDLELAKER